MKKLMILTAVAALLASSVGCECGGLFRRGALFPRLRQDAVCVDPCAPCEAPCVAPACGGGCAPAVTTMPITPGPETYAPAPVN
ncbi:MAG: hypothetical protein ABFD16_20020 [Thermoguttaceae bacterium]|jgi:hypothetical protein